jgi:hypothetical protein
MHHYSKMRKPNRVLFAASMSKFIPRSGTMMTSLRGAEEGV